MKKQTFLFGVLALIIFLGIMIISVQQDSPDKEKPHLVVNGHRIFVEIADSDLKRSQGLSGRNSLPENEGMLFVYDQLGLYSFWMKGMKFNLDFVFIKGQKVVDLVEDVPFPQSGEKPQIIGSSTEFDKVLEINQGMIEKLGLEIGNEIDFSFLGLSKMSTITPTKQSEMVLPIAEFKERITKKPFGIYITPEKSPIQPERFTGYHTGVDVEYDDVNGDVPVFAICDGEVVLTRWVSGYGGAIGLECDIRDQDFFVFYGHLDPKSLTKKIQVKKSDQIAILGEGQTQETDFERKHLHFGIRKNELSTHGYVDTKEALNNWLDPLGFYH